MLDNGMSVAFALHLSHMKRLCLSKRMNNYYTSGVVCIIIILSWNAMTINNTRAVDLRDA